jgi:hypothetical protein
MSFRDLYDYAQTLTLPIQESDIRRKVRDLSGIPVKVIAIGMDPDLMLGKYISHRNEDTLFFKAPAGASVILLSNSLPPDWARFVQLKELMHLFDDPPQHTNTAEEFEQLLIGLCDKLEGRTAQEISELECMWRALAICCPEELRVEFGRQRSVKHLSDPEIAAQLQIPQKFVPHLFTAYYKDNVQHLLKLP